MSFAEILNSYLQVGVLKLDFTLHLLGIDSQSFTHRFQGLDARLTGVEEEAHVIKSILT